jgi:site-specific DNA-methyltransferase (adenine-specific)
MNTELMFSSKTDEWETPQDLFDELDKEFNFTLDVCADFENHKCVNYFDKAADGLKADWHGRCWMNPPYGDPEYPCKPKCKKKKCQERGYHISEYVPGIRDWIKKAYEEVEGGAAEICVCLLPARTDTKWYHDYIYDISKWDYRDGVKVRQLKGRLKFGGCKNSAPFPSMIVIFQKD